MSDEKRELDELRQEMARIDEELLAALEQRARTARRAGEIRKGQPPGALPPGIEREREKALLARATGVLPEESVREVLRAASAACAALEVPVAAAVVGPDGSAAHASARARFGAGAALRACEDAAVALDELARRRCDLAVVPWETSSEGPVQATIGALVAHELKVVEVLDGSFDLHLMSASGEAGRIERVYATAADRVACERGLVAFAGGPTTEQPPSSGARPGAEGRPRIELHDTKSPLAACQFALEDPRAAALVVESTGMALGLMVARRGMRDARGERARFAVVAPRPQPRTGQDLTAVAFSVHDGPGALLDVLKLFAERGINLTKIQSRPVEDDGWSYLFFVELAGHATDRSVVSSFEDVKRAAKYFKVLGSYPSDEVKG